MSSANLKFNPNILKRPLYRGGRSVADARDKAKTATIYKMNSNENMMGPSLAVVKVIQELAEKMNESGILIRPLDQFWGMPEFARVTVGLPVANQAFITALETILVGER